MKLRGGLSIVEVLITVAVGAVVIVLVTRVSSMAGKRQNTSSVRGEALTAAMNLGNHLLTIGRSALACRSPSVDALECDFLPQGTTSLKTLRFKRESVISSSGRSIRVVQVSEAGVVKQSYPARTVDSDVIDFTVCDGNRMASNSCDIEPRGLSSQWASIWSNNNFYFRFRVQIGLPGEPVTGKSVSYQTAFFVRNAMPVDGLLFVSGRDK